MNPLPYFLGKQSSLKGWKVISKKCRNKLKPKRLCYKTTNCNFNQLQLGQFWNSDTLKMLRINRRRPLNLATCALGDLRHVLCKDLKWVEIDSLRFWWNLHKMCLSVQKVKNRSQTCDFQTRLPWKRVMWFWPFFGYLDMNNPQNMHTLYIKYILLCWTRNKSHYIFFMLWLRPQDVNVFFFCRHAFTFLEKGVWIWHVSAIWQK